MNKYMEILRLWGIISSVQLADGKMVYTYNNMFISFDDKDNAIVSAKLPSQLEENFSKKELGAASGEYKKYLFSDELELANFLLEYDKYKDDLIVRYIISGNYGDPKSEIPLNQLTLLADFNKKYRELYPQMFTDGKVQRYLGDESEFIDYCKSRKSTYFSDADRAFIDLIVTAFEGRKTRVYKENVIKLMEWNAQTEQLSLTSGSEVIPFKKDIIYDGAGFIACLVATLKGIGEKVTPLISAEFSDISTRKIPGLTNVRIKTSDFDDGNGSYSMTLSENNTSNRIVYDKHDNSVMLVVDYTYDSTKLEVCHFSNENHSDEMLRGTGVSIKYSNMEKGTDKSFSGMFTYNFDTRKIRTTNLKNPMECQTFSLDTVDESEKDRISTIEQFMQNRIREASEAVDSILLGHSSKRTM